MRCAFRLRVIVVSGCSVAAALACAPAEAQPAVSDTAFADVAESLRAYVDRQNASVGLVVGVTGAQGRRVFSYGQTDRCGSEDCPVSRSTLFQIDSITKLFTALLLADLVAEGVAKLDDPVGAHLPATVDLPESAEAVTLRHLATHTSGLPRLPPGLGWLDRMSGDPYARYAPADLYEDLGKGALQSAPGQAYAYSNYAYGLLGHVLARAAGAESYEAAVTERLFAPLGMTDTRASFADAPALARRRARGHDAAGRPASDWHATEATAGAGSLWSDVDDLLRFVEANLFSEEAPPSLHRPLVLMRQEQPGGRGGRRGRLGWHVREVEGRRYFWQNGGSSGFRSFIGFSAEEEVGVVVLANAAHAVDDVGLHLLSGEVDIAPVPLNTRRRLTLEAGAGVAAGGAFAPSLRVSSWIGDVGFLRIRPFAGYSRFGVEGQPQDEGPAGGAFVFESAEAGVFAEYSGGLFNLILDAAGLPGRVYGGLGMKLNASVRASRRGEGAGAAGSLFTRWSFPFPGARFGYRKGRASVLIESWGRRRYLGPERPLNDVGRTSESAARLVVTYAF